MSLQKEYELLKQLAAAQGKDIDALIDSVIKEGKVITKAAAIAYLSRELRVTRTPCEIKAYFLHSEVSRFDETQTFDYWLTKDGVIRIRRDNDKPLEFPRLAKCKFNAIKAKDEKTKSEWFEYTENFSPELHPVTMEDLQKLFNECKITSKDEGHLLVGCTVSFIGRRYDFTGDEPEPLPIFDTSGVNLRIVTSDGNIDMTVSIRDEQMLWDIFPEALSQEVRTKIKSDDEIAMRELKGLTNSDLLIFGRVGWKNPTTNQELDRPFVVPIWIVNIERSDILKEFQQFTKEPTVTAQPVAQQSQQPAKEEADTKKKLIELLKQGADKKAITEFCEKYGVEQDEVLEQINKWFSLGYVKRENKKFYWTEGDEE